MPLFESVLGAAVGAGITGLFNQHSADKSMSFQKDYGQSAHQWEVRDLIKAGLNPILSVSGGRGAPIGGGAQATIPDLGHSAMEAMQTSSNVDKIEQEISNLQMSRDLTSQQIAQSAQLVLEIQQRTQLLYQQSAGQSFDNVQARIMAEFYGSAELARIAKEFGMSASILKGILRVFFPVTKR